jgi:hypothetical protein
MQFRPLSLHSTSLRNQSPPAHRPRLIKRRRHLQHQSFNPLSNRNQQLSRRYRNLLSPRHKRVQQSLRGKPNPFAPISNHHDLNQSPLPTSIPNQNLLAPASLPWSKHSARIG